MTERRVIFARTGGPEVLEMEEFELAQPASGEAVVRHAAIGLNFIDTYHRSGLYPVELPSGIGSEAAGTIEVVGEDVDGFAPGDRVAYCGGPLGSYATARLYPADRLLRLPASINFEVAAATLLKGCTAEFLIERCARVAPGDTVLVHAAAGGVGSILVPWLDAVGARVIAHAGNVEKARKARALGADHALSCGMDRLAEEVLALTGGEGVRFVFDGVGAHSWAASLASTAKRGLLVSFGNASGPVPPFTPLDLTHAGSIFVTRPTLYDYVATSAELRKSAARLFEMITTGAVPVAIGARFALADAAEAHRAIEDRRTIGATILEP